MNPRILAFVALSSTIGNGVVYAADASVVGADDAAADDPQSELPDLPPLVPLSQPSPARDSAPSKAVSGPTASPAPPVAVTVERRSPWLRTPRLVAYGVGAFGLAAVGVGVASGLDARRAESAYQRASVQVDAFGARQRSVRSGKRANTLFVIGGAVTAGAAGAVALDAFGVFGASDAPSRSAAHASRAGIVPIAGGAMGTWTFMLPSPQ